MKHYFNTYRIKSVETMFKLKMAKECIFWLSLCVPLNAKIRLLKQISIILQYLTLSEYDEP